MNFYSKRFKNLMIMAHHQWFIFNEMWIVNISHLFYNYRLLFRLYSVGYTVQNITYRSGDDLKMTQSN